MKLTPVVFTAPLWSSDPFMADRYGTVEQGVTVQRRAFGNYWSRSMTMNGSQYFVEEWLENGLGRHVEMYDIGLNIAWEGYASTITGNIGGLSITKGPLLDTVANKIKVVYSAVDTSVTPPAVGIREPTAWASDTASQAKYGVIERVISVSGSSATNAAQVRDLALAEFAEPKTSETDNLTSSSAPSVTIECLGYIHWLNAYIYNSTSTGLTNANTKLQNVLAADPNGIFSTIYTFLSTNATQVPQWENEDRTAMTVIKGIVSQGDSSFNRWLFYLGDNRVAYYNVAPSTADYERSLIDPTQRMRDSLGKAFVQPWNVQAGKWVFFTDLMLGEFVGASVTDYNAYLFAEETNLTMPWGLSTRGSMATRLDVLLARLGLGGTSSV